MERETVDWIWKKPEQEEQQKSLPNLERPHKTGTVKGQHHTKQRRKVPYRRKGHHCQMDWILLRTLQLPEKGDPSVHVGQE